MWSWFNIKSWITSQASLQHYYKASIYRYKGKLKAKKINNLQLFPKTDYQPPASLRRGSGKLFISVDEWNTDYSVELRGALEVGGEFVCKLNFVQIRTYVTFW